MARSAFEDAIAELDNVSEDSYKDRDGPYNTVKLSSDTILIGVT